jgi:serine/threonine-protein kinase
VIGGLLEQRYRVDSPLARGGMSTVYRGVDTRLDRPVAIKVMDPRFSGDRSFVERFEREARAAARLHHPNVVAVHDQGVDRVPSGEDRVFLVMELVEGGTLRDLLGERGTLSPALALAVLEPVLSALSAAHRAGLIHRDIKPENVLIGRDGAVKVADFGLVRAVASASTTSDTTILGTVAYLSPEQVATGASDARSDVYSAGITLYEMLTGVPPFTGDTPISVAYRHVNEDVPPPSAAVPGLPAELDELVRRATRRDPAQRLSDASAFLSEVEAVRERTGLPRTPVPAPAPGRDEQTVRVAPVRVAQGPDATVPVRRGVPAQQARPAHAPYAPTQQHVRTPTGTNTGPRGTQALRRGDLAPLPQIAPMPPPQARPEPRAAQPRPDAYESERQRSRRRFAVWTAVVVVLALVVALLSWWLGSERRIAVPDIKGREESVAVEVLRDSSLVPQPVRQASDEVPRGSVISTDPSANQEVPENSQVKLYISTGSPIVPPITAGSEVDAVRKAIEDVGLKVVLDEAANVFDESVPAGKVVTTNPRPSTRASVGGSVTVVLSKGPAPKPVPDVTNKTRDEAFAELTAAGFEPFDAGAEQSAQVEGGRVVRTTPPATTVVTGGDKRVGVILSSSIAMPNVTGQKVDDAKRILGELGLQVDVQFNNRGDARVFNQSVPPGTKVDRGARITLFAI